MIKRSMHTRVSRLAARLAPRVGGHAWQEVLLDSGGVAGGVHLRNQRGHRVLEVGCIVDRELEFELGE